MIIGSCAGAIHVLDRRTGEPVWNYDTGLDGRPVSFHGEALLLGGTVIVPSDAVEANLYAFDAQSGELLWKKPFEGGISTDPLLIGTESVIATTATGLLVAADPRSGKTRWTIAPERPASIDHRLPSPVLAGKRVWFSSDRRTLSAADPVRGSVELRKDLGTEINTSLAFIDGSVWAGGVDRQLYRIDPSSGAILSRIALKGVPYGTIIAAPDRLLVLVDDGLASLVAIDRRSGEVVWQQSTPREWTTYRPLVAGSDVIVGSEEKELCAFLLEDGAIRWCRAIDGLPRGLSVRGDTLYAGTYGGKVFAFSLP